MSLKREMSAAALANWFGTAASFVLAFIATPIIVHSFGPERYGLWSVAMSLTGYYGVLDIGLRTTVIRYYAKYDSGGDQDAANSLVNTALATCLLLIPVVAAVVASVVGWLPTIFEIEPALVGEARVVFGVVGATFCLGVLGNVFRAVVVGMKRFGVRNSVEVGFGIVRSGVIIGALKGGLSWVHVAVAVLVIDLVMNVTYAAVVLRLCPSFRLSRRLVDFGFMRDKYVFAAYNLMRQVSLRFLERSDIILVGILADMKSAAYYGIADSIVRYLLKIPKGLRMTVVPFASGLGTTDEREQLAWLAGALPRYTFSFFCFALLAFALFGRDFIGLWLGPGYGQVYPIVLLLAAARGLAMSQSMMVHVVVGMGFNRYYGLLGPVELGVSLLSGVALFQVVGPMGIAVGRVAASCAVCLVLMPVHGVRAVGLRLPGYYVSTFVLPALLTSVLYLVNMSVAGAVGWLWFPAVVLQFLVASYFVTYKELRAVSIRSIFSA